MDVSVVISTFNRAALAEETVRRILASRVSPNLRFEIVVVDNNSADATRAVIDALVAEDARVRYRYEPRKGLSHGRNCGIAASSGDVVAITDDDVVVDEDWLAAVHASFEAPWVAFAGGRILPRWEVPRPAWLPDELMGPIVCSDQGDAELVIDGRAGVHLPMGPNMAFRRSVLDRVGPFRADLGWKGGSRHGSRRPWTSFISGEDQEIGTRLLRAGHRGLYNPRMTVHHRVNAERLDHGYYRRWMFGHGMTQAMIAQTHDDGLVRWLGVPRYLYREFLRDAAGVAWYGVRGQRRRAFLHEVRCLGFAGYLWQRWARA